MNAPIMLLVLAAFLALSVGNTVVSLKRGIRNNNPGNIKHSNDKWVGASPIQDDSMFVKFISPAYGIRAMYRTLMTYRNTHKLDTIKGIIMRWAKKDVHGEVPYESYFSFLEKRLNLSRNSVIPLSKYPELIAAIIQFENGQNPYTWETINEGIKLA